MSSIVVKRKTARITAGALGIAGVVGLAWVGDTAVAANVERQISDAVHETYAPEAGTALETAPSVYVGGIPYLQALLSSQVPVVGVSALDVEVDGVGMVNTGVTLQGVKAEANQVWSGDFVGANAQSMRRTLRLDGVAMGQWLGMSDLTISHPKNISPGGGTATEAVFQGRPPGFHEPVSVLATLRLVGDEFQLRPTKILQSSVHPEDADDDALAAFDLTVNTTQLPLDRAADAVYLEGGSIVFEAVRNNVIVQPEHLSPVGNAAQPGSAARKPTGSFN